MAYHRLVHLLQVIAHHHQSVQQLEAQYLITVHLHHSMKQVHTNLAHHHTNQVLLYMKEALHHLTSLQAALARSFNQIVCLHH